MIFRFFSFNGGLFRSCLAASFLLTACGTTATVITPVAQTLPTCISPTLEANPYLAHQLSTRARDIYSSAFTNLGLARQEALSQLGKNTEHWSDQVDLALDDFQMVRITVTYLDPVLIQYIVLNHVLNGPNVFVASPGLEGELAQIMRKLADRYEMLFVITVTSPFYREQAYTNVLTVGLPIERLALISSADMHITPTHEDHILDENMDITHGPISGLVGYPLAVMRQEQCLWITDQWTNTLTLEVPSVTLGSTPLPAQFWSIPYRALVMETDASPVATYDPNYAGNPISDLETPPTPNWKPNTQFDDTNWTLYWEDMGRFLWNLVIIESHH